MNGTRTTPTSFCGIVLRNGRDCPGWVNPDFPLNLCGEHLTAAAELHHSVMAEPAQLAKCPLCDAVALHPGLTGSMCARCGHQTDDFTGRIVVTHAEQHARQAAQAEARPVVKRATDVVYYLRFGDRIKIGTSGHLRARIRGLPHDDVLGVERGNRSVEQSRHHQFKHLRLTGEWFTAAPDLLEHISNLHGPGKSWYHDLATIEGRR